MTTMDSKPAQSSDPAPETIRSLFDRECRFQIPSYQRAYSWEVKQLRQLIEDLVDHLEGSPYYFGHFIFERGDSNDTLLIIDGQQRLTTLVLFVAAVARELAQQHNVSGVDVPDLKKHYLSDRLRTVEDDQNAFSDLIEQGETADRRGSHSKKRLIDATRFLGKALRGRDPLILVSWLHILETAQITTFTVHGKPQAAQIFTLQNSRGKELTDLEKLKAFLMFGIYLHAEPARSTDAIRLVERSFASIYRHIETITLMDEDAVLGHHDRAYSTHGGTPLENIKRDLAAAGEKAARVHQITEFAKALANTFQHVAALETILQSDEIVADPIILDSHNAWPLLIKLYRYYGDAIRTDDQLRKLLRNVELVLLKLRFQHGRSSNDLIGETKRLDGTPENLRSFCALMEQAVSHGFRGRGDFNQKVLSYLDGDHHYDSRFRYILWKYENSLRQSGDHQVSPADFISIDNRRMDSTTEHIAPQNGDYTDEFRHRRINNLGNLLFMPRGLNSSLSDQPPLEKAKRFDTSYASHREAKRLIESAGGWDEPQILARKAEIVRFIRDRWQVAGNENAAIAQ